MKSMRSLALTIFVLVGVIALFWAGRHFNLQDYLRGLLSWIRSLGAWGILIFGLTYIAATIAFIPGLILTLGAGFLFGVLQGTAIVSVASTLGAGASFLIGRYLARDWVARRIEGNVKFRRIDEAVGKEGWRIVGLVRLSPIFPFNLLNYAFGLTRVSFKEYILASWLGMLPATALYVYLGSLAGDLATLGAGRHARTPAQWLLFGVGLAATIVVVIQVTRIARNSLNEKIS